MKFIKSLCIVLIFILFFVVGNAQQTKPSPPPVRKGVTTVTGTSPSPTPEPPPKAVGESDSKSWKEFVNDDSDFSVIVIGEFTRKTESFDIGIGTVERVILSWHSFITECAIFYTDYPFSPVEDEQKIAAYDEQQNRIIGANNKLISQKDFKYEIYLGREIIFESPVVKAKIRMIYVGNRFYQQIIVYSSASSKTNAGSQFINDVTEKFFSSFKLSKTALQKAQNEISEVKEPSLIDQDQIEAKFEGTKYTNDILGLALELPQNWYQLSLNETALAQDIGFEMLSKETTQAKRNQEVAKKRGRILFALTNANTVAGKSKNLVFIVERLPYKKISLDLVVKNNLKTMSETLKGIKVIGIPINRKIAGKDFSEVNILINLDGSAVKQKLLMAIHKGVLISFALTYIDDKDLPDLEQLLNSLKFL